MTKKYKRRIMKERPLGAVSCVKCGENKNSGSRITFEGENPKRGYYTENQVLCDNCIRSLRNWYRNRSDDQGFVVTKTVDT